MNFLYDNFYFILGETLSNHFVDTLRIARKLLPELRHHRLDDLTSFFGIELRDKHRALNDCLLTNKVYLKMCDMVYDRYRTWDKFQKQFKQIEKV